MTVIDYIKMELEMAQGWLLPLYEDLSTAPMVMPTPNGGNHAIWTVGHMAYSESNILNSYILGKENPLEDWKEMFGGGSVPHDDASQYPSFEELMAKYKEVHSDLMAYLDTITDADLGNSTSCPEDYKAYFGTVAQCLAIFTTHFAFHGGQMADARRADGRPIMMS